MFICGTCGTSWTVRLAVCAARGCTGQLRPVGPGDAGHTVLRRWPLARVRGTTATTAPAAVAPLDIVPVVGADVGALPRPAPAPTTGGRKASARARPGRRVA